MTTPQLRYDVEIPVVVVRGEIDASNANAILLALVDDVPDDAPGLVLDLRQTEYLDSAGIRALFELARRLRVRRQQLRIAAPKDGVVRRVLTLTAFTEVVELHEEVEAACAALTTR